MDILIEHLEKKIGDKQVLAINQLQFNSGKLYGIIGANGAGKTTLLNIIAAIESASSGMIFYGQSKRTIPDYNKLTLVSQSPYMIQTTAEKNIAYPLKIRKWSKEAIKKRMNELLRDFGLQDLAQKNAVHLSSGEKQKVSLARALAFHPDILLLDEPTANIDPGTTKEIENMLKKINLEEQVTIIMITHNLAQARRICSDIVFLHEGKVIESSTSDELIYHPKNELTARFIAGELL